jgi:hypothetical protein
MKLSEVLSVLNTDYMGIGTISSETLGARVRENLAKVQRELELAIQSPDDLTPSDVDHLLEYLLDYYTQIFLKPTGRDHAIYYGMLTREEQDRILENLNNVRRLLGAPLVNVRERQGYGTCEVVFKETGRRIRQ